LSTVKGEALSVINSLPDDCTMEDIHYHLYVREKVKRGIEDADASKAISQEEMEQRIGQWQESAGPDQQSTT